MAIIMFTISGGLFTTCKKPMPPIKKLKNKTVGHLCWSLFYGIVN